MALRVIRCPQRNTETLFSLMKKGLTPHHNLKRNKQFSKIDGFYKREGRRFVTCENTMALHRRGPEKLNRISRLTHS